jgi:membrane-bound lytic murein transglycosylase D
MVVSIGLLGRARSAPAPDDVMTLDDLVSSAEQWAKENLDEDALRVLQNADREKVTKLFQDIHKQFQNNYVLDLGVLRDTVNALLPLLDSYEETRPYAAWLKSRLDYLEVAQELRRAQPEPRTPPTEPPQPRPNPPAPVEREIWIKKLAERPWPKGAKPYVAQLKPIFKKQKVPAELVWIAEVESGFDPRARSPEGATGLFQLMPATAKRFGLRVRPFDDRLKPQESAEAAAKYLQYLHGHYQDWRLALAAYNAGEGTVDKLLKRRKARTYDAIAVHLPAETQLYVPKMEATLLRREGLKLSQLSTPASQ